jgi:hypothetical protein
VILRCFIRGRVRGAGVAWRVWKEHLRDTGPGSGHILTEFLPPVGYAAPDDGIVAAAGHHIMEGRWVRGKPPAWSTPAIMPPSIMTSAPVR